MWCGMISRFLTEMGPSLDGTPPILLNSNELWVDGDVVLLGRSSDRGDQDRR